MDRLDLPNLLRRLPEQLHTSSDGLMHNEVVKSDIHSTDAFGFSELVFAVSHLLGFSYAPRFKNLPRQRRPARKTAKISGYAIDWGAAPLSELRVPEKAKMAQELKAKPRDSGNYQRRLSLGRLWAVVLCDDCQLHGPVNSVPA